MRKYFVIFKASFQENIVYRGPIFFRGLRHILIVVLFISLWGSLYKNRSIINGFDFKAIVTYYILIEMTDVIYTSWPARLLSKHINTGDLNNFIIRPVNYWGYNFAYVLGRQVASASFSVLLVILGFVFFPNYLVIQGDWFYLASFLLIMVISYLLSAQIFYIIGLVTFWTSETSHLRQSASHLMGILGGRWIPLIFFPPVAASILGLLPFQYLFNFLVMVYQAKISQTVIINGFLTETIWFVITLIAGNLLWVRGVKKYEAYGR